MYVTQRSTGKVRLLYQGFIEDIYYDEHTPAKISHCFTEYRFPIGWKPSMNFQLHGVVGESKCIIREATMNMELTNENADVGPPSWLCMLHDIFKL